MQDISQIFGSMVFGDRVMRERLPEDAYKAVQRTMKEGKQLNETVAGIMAEAMKKWALENGATHYTHWFQPMTGVTAEKHDSFISPNGEDGVIMSFSGKALLKGESDASSFPSGGLRTTFEARGYTAWDPTSYAFIKDNTLCIPTAFFSYSGECLDKKTPLLRSVEVIGRAAKRILRLFGDTETARVIPTVGAEQEYFLIDREMYEKRRDLVFTGRTLFGAKPPKGQEMDDHYFGTIKPRVLEYMKDLDCELWKLGVYAKTEHNEAAPSQHELAPVFTSVNSAADHNQLTMELMKKVAEKHGLVCLLHEKPFAGVNGSGKHNNWSLSTDRGKNLLNPGQEPQNNKQFLLILAAIIKAADEHQDLLRFSVATAGNDHRLGANEAPPAIISVFLGEELTGIFEAMEKKTSYEREREMMTVGTRVLPRFARDTADRNRTSPLAFTGNKFEFRMLGSASSIAEANIVMNTIIADALSDFADRLEKAEDFDRAVDEIIRDTYKKHKRIIFGGDNYAKEWEKEAEKRGLLNLRTTPEALMVLETEKNVALFKKHGIFTEGELHSRFEIQMEEYCKVIHIEALTMLEMVRREILPAVTAYAASLGEAVSLRQNIGMPASAREVMQLSTLYDVADRLYAETDKLEEVIKKAEKKGEGQQGAQYYCGTVSAVMDKVRAAADKGEEITASGYWPFPTYADMLFS